MSHNTIKISASILSANFLILEKEINTIKYAGIDSLHLDVMDNHMAPCLSFGPPVIKAIRSSTNLPLDTHLMIDSPWLFFNHYIECGVNSICFHIEAYTKNLINHEKIKSESRKISSDNIHYDQLERDINDLKNQNISVGITINPNTPIDVLKPILMLVDSVLIMSVHPGFSGQSFINSTFNKIRDLRQIFSKEIKIDGGVNNKNAKDLIKSGADTLISASYIFGSNDYKTAIDSLKQN